MLKGGHDVTQPLHLIACGFERFCAVENSLTVAVEVAERIGLNAIGENAEQQMTRQGRGRAGFDNGRPWQVLRLRLPNAAPACDADTALVRRPEEAAIAKASGFSSALAVGGGLNIGTDAPDNLIVLPTRFAYLSDGDVLGFQAANRRFRTLYRRSSSHNSFLVTERCNHYCLMCSQPPRDIDDRWLLDEIEAAIGLVDPLTASFAFTGGEPLLEWQRFIEILGRCRDALPNTAVHVLTNGRGFAHSETAKAWASVRHPKLMAGIPIYCAVDHVHDYVVQAHGAFDETVLGVLKLKDRGQRVEIRVCVACDHRPADR